MATAINAPHAPLAGTLGLLGHIEAEPQSLLEDRPSMPGTPRLRMTRWFDPIERFRTSGHAKRARKHDDREPTANEQSHLADPILRRYEADEFGSFWFDYVADLGDAFDPTVQIAWTLGRRSVTFVPEGSGAPVPLHRGPLLILGGDEVYPYGTADCYRDQTVLPYTLGREADRADAADRADVGADVLAIPGNHDWWGGLSCGATCSAARCRSARGAPSSETAGGRHSCRTAGGSGAWTRSSMGRSTRRSRRTSTLRPSSSEQAIASSSARRFRCGGCVSPIPNGWS